MHKYTCICESNWPRQCVNKPPLHFFYKLKPFYVNVCVCVVGVKGVCKNT